MTDARDAASDDNVHCVHAHECSGCPWMARDYTAQLREKRARVADTFVAFDELRDVPVSSAQRAPQLMGYRVRAKLVVGRAGALGLFARGTHDVVDIPHCRVLDPMVADAVSALRRGLALPPVIDGADLVRVGDALMVTLIARDGASEQDVSQLALRLREVCPVIAGVAVSRRAQGAVQLIGGDLRALSGPGELPCRLEPSGPYHYATFGAFVQAHPQVARALYSRIVGEVFARAGTRPKVLELYAGSGALSLSLAAQGAQVVSVESFSPACARLERAAREQSLPVEVRTGDAAEVAQQLAREGARFDVVLVNPPRRGLEKDVRRAIASLRPEHVAYVSCQPATLARDLAHLAHAGLRAQRVEPFDMIPLTEHVESLAWLEHGSTPAPHVLYEHEAFLAVAKAPHEPTTPQGEHERSLLERVQTMAGFACAAPVHRLDVGTSGVCLFARTPSHVSELAKALGEGEKAYVALVHGIARRQGRIQRTLVEQGRPLEARTRYRRHAVICGHSLVDVWIETGRKHQIRRHFAHIGHPVVGDGRHGDARTNLHFAMRHGLDRPFLHCASIALSVGGRRIEVQAPLAPDLGLVLRSLEQDARPGRTTRQPARQGERD